MGTDWSALLKAVFGSAYPISDPVIYSDALSTPGCRQRCDLYASCRRQPYTGCRFRDALFSTVAHVDGACAVSPVEESWPCDVTMTSFPVTGSAVYGNAPPQSLVQMSEMTAASNRCFEGVDVKHRDLPV